MSEESGWREALTGITGKPMTDVMARRLVNRQHLQASVPPDYLFTSGRPGRFNPRGILSIYASDNLITAAAEWERYWDGLPQSYLMYFVQFSGLLLDLGDPSILEQLKIDPKELFDSWKFAASPTRCQLLGQLVAEQTRLAGI